MRRNRNKEQNLPNETKTRKRDHAILAILLGCGLRRAELIRLKLAHLQQRDDHWSIVDLFGKGVMCTRCRYPAR
jgi:integrase